MTGRTHDLAAFTALGFIALTYNLPHYSLATGLVAIGANLVGGITPDIDQPTAPFWKNLPIGGIFGRIFDKFLGGHRFLSHSILGLGIFSIGFYDLLQVFRPSFPNLNMNIIWWAFFIGYFSHLIMDSFTREGVPWLLPIPVKLGFPPIKSLRIQTGGIIESFIVFPGLFVLNGFLYYYFYDRVLYILHNYVR